MNKILPKQIPMRKASESEYSMIARAVGVSSHSIELIMSNGVKVGERKNYHAYVSPEALKVAKDRQQELSHETIIQKETTVTNNKKKSTGKILKTNYVLIDFENVQPKNIEILKGHDFKVILFVGEKQTKIPFELVKAMQSLGDSADYIKINGNGPNALDFHIAFYIGLIATKDNDAFFHIISKDTGFDPLIRHLKSRKISAQREKTIAEIPLLKISNSKSKTERVDAIVEFLKARGNAKPRTVKTLSNSINSLFSRTLEENELLELIKELIKRKVVIENGTKVTYKL